MKIWLALTNVRVFDYRQLDQYFINLNAFPPNQDWLTRTQATRILSISTTISNFKSFHSSNKVFSCSLCVSANFNGNHETMKTQMHLLMHKGNENSFEMQPKSNQCETVCEECVKQWQRRQAYHIDESISFESIVSHSFFVWVSCSWFMRMTHTVLFALYLLNVKTKISTTYSHFVGQNVTWMNKKC